MDHEWARTSLKNFPLPPNLWNGGSNLLNNEVYLRTTVRLVLGFSYSLSLGIFYFDFSSFVFVLFLFLSSFFPCSPLFFVFLLHLLFIFGLCFCVSSSPPSFFLLLFLLYFASLSSFLFFIPLSLSLPFPPLPPASLYIRPTTSFFSILKNNSYSLHFLLIKSC